MFWKIYKKRRGCQFATYPSLLALALPSPQDKQRASPRRAILYLTLGRLLVAEGYNTPNMNASLPYLWR
ncbi:MAG: hypothetical protein II293_03875 [Bacteroidaceae bacterium]|nr:hypothetical protein [Bacteroidaceae bacterium]